VARLEALAAKIQEARHLRRQCIEEADVLLLQGLKSLLKPGDSWPIEAIAACSSMSTGTTPPSHREDYYGGDIQWYTPGDLEFRQQLPRSQRTVSDLAVTEGKVRIFRPGTILLVSIGASLGKVGLATEPCSSNQQITGIKFRPEMLPEFGFWWMRSLYDELRAAAPHATLPIINQRRTGEFKIAIPPVEDQRRIVAYLDGLQAKVDALKKLQAETAAELDALLPSILDRAFRGEL
jgi:type I restriction enzyme S subunit